MKKIIVAGFGQPLLDIIAYLQASFEVVGVVLDYQRERKFPLFYADLVDKQITIFDLNNLNIVYFDAMIVINFNKIIDIRKIQCPFILNIHMGILPVYRGNSANSWSILNGDRDVGYTLHEVSDVLDGGPIYYKFKYQIKENETYFQAKNAINRDLQTSLPVVLDKILKSQIKKTYQESEEFVYASKLIAEDAFLQDWDYTTAEIINRNIIFSKPLGTGLKLRFNGEYLEVSRLSTIPKYKISKGFNGAIVLKTIKGSIWVKTKDTAISIDELIINGQLIKPANLFKIGERL